MTDYILPSQQHQEQAAVTSAQSDSTYVLPSQRGHVDSPSIIGDIAKAIPSKFVQGVAALPSIPTDLADAGDKALGWVGNKLRTAAYQAMSGRSSAPVTWGEAQQHTDKQDVDTAQHVAVQKARMKAWAAQHGVPYKDGVTSNMALVRGVFPGSAERITGVNKAIGAISKTAAGDSYHLYEPQTAPGRVAGAIAGAIPSAGLGAGTVGANILRNVPIVLPASATGATLREAVGNDSPWATAVDVAGNLAAGILGGGASSLARTAAKNRSAPVIAERASGIAGQALREGYADPVAASAKLAGYTANPPPLLPGVKPTTAQVIGTGEAQAVEHQITQLTKGEGSPELSALTNAKDYALQQVDRGVAFDPQTGEVNIANAIGAHLPEVDPVTAVKEPPTEALNAATRSALGIEEGAQGAHATRASEALSKLDSHYEGLEDAAWGDLDSLGAELNVKPVVQKANNYLENLDEADKPYVPARIRTVLDNIESKFAGEEAKPFSTIVGGQKVTFDPVQRTWTHKGEPATPGYSKMLDTMFPDVVAAPASITGAPIRQIQGLRRNILKDARAAYKQGDENTARVLNGLGGELGDALSSGENYNFAGEAAPQAWSKAVAATKQRKEYFGSGFARDATDTLPNGSPKIAGDAFFEKLFKGGSQAGENLKQIQSIPGMDASAINSAASDWMVGKLTKNGTKLDFTPEQVGQFANNPANKTIIDQIPGLSDRLETLGQQAQSRLDTLGQHAETYKSDVARNADEVKRFDTAQKLSNDFQSKFQAGKPAALADFIAGNRDALKATMPPEQAHFLDALENSARFVSKLPDGGAVNSTRTMQALKNGTLLTLLYGKATGTIADMAAASVLGAVIDGASLAHTGPLAFALGMASKARNLKSMLEGPLSGLILGNTRAEATRLLQLAAADPELAQVLMQRPSPESMLGVLGVLKKAGKSMTETGAKSLAFEAARPAPTESKPPESLPNFDSSMFDENMEVPMDTTVDPMFDENMSVPLDDRPQRASGGRVDGARVDRLVKALITKAKKSKKLSDKGTETLLSVDDSTIAKALQIAQKAI